MPDTAEQHRAAQVVEYGTYVATEVILVNGARAFNAGDPVPVSHVERGLVGTEQVARLTTKAGRAAAGIDDDTKG